MFTEPAFIKLAIAYLLGIMMPGPSATLIIKTAIIDSRAAGIRVSLGIMAGIALQAGIVLIGISHIYTESFIFKILTLLCSFYLIYLGFNTLSGKIRRRYLNVQDNQNSLIASQKNYFSYFAQGFLLEILNPIAFTFFLSILTLIIDTSCVWYVKSFYWIEIIILGFLWFNSIVLIASIPRVRSYMRKFINLIEWFAGGAFLIFGSLMSIKNLNFY